MPEFNNQSVRDLAWAISSPPLISNLSSHCVWPETEWFQKLCEESLPWLRRVDEDPFELEELLNGQKDRRLGKYFETLWAYWLSHNPRYDIIENNLQIIIDGETLGEIDFVVFDKVMKRTLHWEVAVKFYLGTDDTSRMSNWYGPHDRNRLGRDRLDIKVEHLLQRQSLISKQPRVAEWLKQRGICIDGCAVILKGRLYYPWSQKRAIDTVFDAMAPLQCSADHLRSWWLSTEQFKQAFDDKEPFIPIINKGWLERISTASVKTLYFKKDIFETISNKNLRLPLHLNLCNPQHSWDRVFLTGVDWPQKII